MAINQLTFLRCWELPCQSFLKDITLPVAICCNFGKCCKSHRSAFHAVLPEQPNLANMGINGSLKLRSAILENPWVTSATSSRVMGCSNSEISASGAGNKERS